MTFFYKWVEENSSRAAALISEKIAKMKGVLNMHYGSPTFELPDYLLDLIENTELQRSAFLTHSKKYESQRGSLELRHAIASWYKKRLDITVDADKEILVTSGSSEAIALAIMSTTDINDNVMITDPSYTSFYNTITSLDRRVVYYDRANDVDAFLDLSACQDSLSAFIINSPENPSGYMLTAQQWGCIADFCKKNNAWLIHDEVLDVLTFADNYYCARMLPQWADRSVLVNGMSKTFALPGLRVGWMIAPPAIINKAAKLKSFINLSLNTQAEAIACHILSDEKINRWVKKMRLK